MFARQFTNTELYILYYTPKLLWDSTAWFSDILNKSNLKATFPCSLPACTPFGTVTKGRLTPLSLGTTQQPHYQRIHQWKEATHTQGLNRKCPRTFSHHLTMQHMGETEAHSTHTKLQKTPTLWQTASHIFRPLRCARGTRKPPLFFGLNVSSTSTKPVAASFPVWVKRLGFVLPH